MNDDVGGRTLGPRHALQSRDPACAVGGIAGDGTLCIASFHRDHVLVNRPIYREQGDIRLERDT